MIENGVLLLRAAVLDPDGKRRIAAENQGPDSSPEKLGEELANILMSQGAGELLSQIPLTQSLEATP
jgi:porphobilinogen deaminase